MSKLLNVFIKNTLMQLGNKSQRWLSKESGVNQSAINQLLNGKGNPSLDTIEAIANALNVHPSVLIGGTEGKTYDIPKDLLELLENESPVVYDTIRTMLRLIKTEREKNRS